MIRETVTAIRWTVIIAYVFLAALPLAWMGITSLKHYDDTISRNPRFVPAPPTALTSSLQHSRTTTRSFESLPGALPGVSMHAIGKAANTMRSNVLSYTIGSSARPLHKVKVKLSR